MDRTFLKFISGWKIFKNMFILQSYGICMYFCDCFSVVGLKLFLCDTLLSKLSMASGIFRQDTYYFIHHRQNTTSLHSLLFPYMFFPWMRDGVLNLDYPYSIVFFLPPIQIINMVKFLHKHAQNIPVVFI